MTYLAPRQGLFAIIILISFFIHTALLLMSTDQQLDKLKLQAGDRMLVQLIEEVKLPLLSKDKVSLSVLTGRYTSENNVASLTVKDIDGEVLLQTGLAQLLDGDKIRKSVVLEDNVIGEVEMTLRDTSSGEIIASQWIYILGSFIVHILIWLAYGYVARPTRAQLAALSRDVKDYLNQQQREEYDNDTPDANLQGRSLPSKKGDSDSDGLSVQQALNNYIKTQQQSDTLHNDNTHNGIGESSTIHNDSNGDSNENARPHSDASVAEADIKSSNSIIPKFINEKFGKLNAKKAHKNNHTNNKDTTQPTDCTSATDETSESAIAVNSHIESQAESRQQGTATPAANPQPELVANRPLDIACVQIRFDDPNSLLQTLAFEKSKPYFALCTQLLQRTLDELLKQPLLYGVSVKNEPVFDESGAMVELTSQDNHSKLGLAAMMLAKAFVMLNDVTYFKHRELQRFALEVMVGVSDRATTQKMAQLMQNNARANDILTLLPVDGIKQLRGNIQLSNLKNPTTVYERDCAYLEGLSDPMMQRITQIRNAVLLSAIK